MRVLGGFPAQTARLVSATAIILVLSLTASAYTLVMRGGKVIHIPDKFTVTQTTVTYEVAPGINVTVQMAAIDITATEKANNESPGSLLRRVEATAAAQAKPAKPSQAKVVPSRSITNRELEPAMRARRESEKAYEQRRKELGLPPLEESRRRIAEEADRALQQIEQMRAEDKEAERYWRARAFELRSEIAAMDAQINFIRARLAEFPFPSATGSFTVVSTALFALANANAGQALNPALIPPGSGTFQAPLAGHVGFGGGLTRGHVLVNPVVQPTIGSQFIVPSIFSVPSVVFASPFQPADFTYQRSFLITRLDELLTIRAGLGARWRALEDEARRAGVPPGWLR
jgi:hypothetical protein